MAIESVATHPEKATKYLIDADEVRRVRHMLLDAIKAASELETLRKNIIQAAEGNLPASVIVKAGMLPRLVDVDIADTADMVMILEMLPCEKEATP